MTDGHDLSSALVERAKGYRERLPVFRVAAADPRTLNVEALGITTRIWPFFGDCQPRLRPPITNGVATMLTPEGGHLGLFYPSGAIAATLRTKASRAPLAANEADADRKHCTTRLTEIASSVAEHRVTRDDQLRFEALWETKAQGVTLKGERTPTALMEVVGAFRRYLHDVPVYGRASVHVALGGNSEVTSWGMDWRRVSEAPFATTDVVDPREGAKRIMDDLAWRRPERPFTLDDFVPASFLLGYVSLTRRREQSVMQPAWVAVLKPRGATTMGHVIAVPAAPHPFEPMGRPARMMGL